MVISTRLPTVASTPETKRLLARRYCHASCSFKPDFFIRGLASQSVARRRIQMLLEEARRISSLVNTVSGFFF